MKWVTTFIFCSVIWAAADSLVKPAMQPPQNISTVHVSSAAELMSALSKAKGGEIILLNGGNYGDLTLSSQKHPFSKFAETVTIKSADPENVASFTSFKLSGVENLAFDSIKFDYVSTAGAPEWLRPFQIVGSSNKVTITNSIFDGDLAHGATDIANGYGTGIGLGVDGATNITISDTTFFNWHRAAVYSAVDGLNVVNNEVHSVRSDGFDFVVVNNVLIEGNYLHDFVASRQSGDHRDMIQFWTNGAINPSTNITIRGNILDSGSGAETQSIFMRNEEVDTGRQGDKLFYQNILIEDNVIYNGHLAGITVGETHGLTIRNNTILQNKAVVGDATVHVPTINIKASSTDVLVANNIVPRLSLQSTANATIENNLVVQRASPDAANYYGDLFVNALADGDASIFDLKAVPGGLIEKMGVGSSLTIFQARPDMIKGFIANQSGAGLELHKQDFDASNLFGPEGKISTAGATVIWDFGDGTSGSGLNAVHTFGRAGSYNVSATVMLSDGGVVMLRKAVQIGTPVALQANFDEGANDLSDVANAVTVGQAVTFEKVEDGLAARLNGGVITYARGPELLNNAEYTVLLDFKKDKGAEAAAGRIINFTGSFVVMIQADGVHATITTDKGTGTIKADRIGIKDADWHQVALTFSGKQGAATLYVDGKEVGRLSGLDGHVQSGLQSHDFHIGNPFGAGGFPGLVDNVSFLRGALTTEQVASYYKSPWDIHPDTVPVETPPANTPPQNQRGEIDLEHYPRLLAASFEGSAKDLSITENTVAVGNTVNFEACDRGEALRLNGGVVTYAQSAELFNNTEYSLVFDFKKDVGAETAAGRVINFSYSFVLFVEADGINASITTDQGGGWIKTKGLGIKDADWHQVALTFSGEEGEAILYLDGNEVGRLEGLEGHIQKGNLSHALHVGDPFNGKGFPGLIDNLVFLQGAMTAEEVQANYEAPYDFCKPATTVADAAESGSLALSSDASGSSSAFVAPADSTNKMAPSADSSTAIQTASAPASSTTSGVSVGTSAILASDILVTSYSTPTQPVGQDSFAFTPSLSGSDASDELLTWSPEGGEVAPISSDVALAEELTQVYEAQTPELLLV